jgi:predicted transcriptional regulator
MEIIWDLGEASAAQVRDALQRRRTGARNSGARSPVARNTVRTLLERMEAKGWLVHRELGRTFVYRPARPRRATLGRKLRELIDSLCDGSPATLVAALLDDRRVDHDELERIRHLLEQARAERPAHPSGNKP